VSAPHWRRRTAAAALRLRCQISKNPDIRRRVSDGAQNLQTWKTALRVGRLLYCTGYGCALYGSRSRDYYAAQNFFYGQKMHFRRQCTLVEMGLKKIINIFNDYYIKIICALMPTLHSG
jgi:hypothetical protein